MALTRVRGKGTRRRRTTLRLLLVLLLAWAPLLSSAQGLPTTRPPAGESAHAGMPCHTSAPDDPQTSPDGGQHHACPHCGGDSSVPACQCGGHSAPAGLANAGFMAAGAAADRASPPAVPTEALPRVAGGRLFRPPIALS